MSWIYICPYFSYILAIVGRLRNKITLSMKILFALDVISERDRCYDDRRLVVGEPLLNRRAILVRHARVIRFRIEAARAERFRRLLDLFARRTIDYSRLAARALEKVDDLVVDVLLVRYLIEEIRTVEGRFNTERVAQLEGGFNILADEFGRGRGKGGDGALGKRFDNSSEFEVVRAEIMTPLRNAVRLVDGEEADVDFGKKVGEGRRIKAFRRDVKEIELIAIERDHNFAPFRRGGRGVNRRRVHAVFERRVDLILHEREERTNDDADALPDNRRKLIAERFPAPGRHDGKDVATLNNRARNFALVRAKRAKAKDVGERAIEELVELVGGFVV